MTRKTEQQVRLSLGDANTLWTRQTLEGKAQLIRLLSLVTWAKPENLPARIQVFSLLENQVESQEAAGSAFWRELSWGLFGSGYAVLSWEIGCLIKVREALAELERVRQELLKNEEFVAYLKTSLDAAANPTRSVNRAFMLLAYRTLFKYAVPPGLPLLEKQTDLTPSEQMRALGYYLSIGPDARANLEPQLVAHYKPESVSTNVCWIHFECGIWVPVRLLTLATHLFIPGEAIPLVTNAQQADELRKKLCHQWGIQALEAALRAKSSTSEKVSAGILQAFGMAKVTEQGGAVLDAGAAVETYDHPLWKQPWTLELAYPKDAGAGGVTDEQGNREEEPA